MGLGGFLLNMRREASVMRTLRAMGRRRVSMVLQPGNVWVIENAIRANDQVDADLRTCYLRGWVEPISDPIPHGTLRADLSFPTKFSKLDTIYAVTACGWSVIQTTRLVRYARWLLLLLTVASSVASILALRTTP